MNRRALALAALALAAVPVVAAPPAPGATALPPGELWHLDQIRVAAPADIARLAALKDDHTMAAVADHLRRMGIRFTRAPVTLRPADLPAGLVAQLRALPPGEPFVLPADGVSTINALVADAAGKAAPLWSPAIAGEPDAARLAAARRFLDAAIPPAEREHFFDRIADATMGNMIAGLMRAQPLQGMLAAHPSIGPVVAQFTSRQRELTLADLRAHLPQLIEAETIGYARLFTADELTQLAAFFGQPLGRRYLLQSQLLPAQPELAAWQQGMTMRAQQRMPAEVQVLMGNIQAALAKEKSRDVF